MSLSFLHDSAHEKNTLRQFLLFGTLVLNLRVGCIMCPSFFVLEIMQSRKMLQFMILEDVQLCRKIYQNLGVPQMTTTRSNSLLLIFSCFRSITLFYCPTPGNYIIFLTMCFNIFPNFQDFSQGNIEVIFSHFSTYQRIFCCVTDPADINRENLEFFRFVKLRL